VYGLILYIGMGLMTRLMPQMQVFFIILPLQIIAAFFVLMVTLGAIMIWFLDYFEEGLAQFLAPGV
ncbi:MAG: flagellar biosynthetic protein FliR, partial [Proteobacteria bacterium]|nr:flagellar biosynthetic protein FliR [Pseudomonadota bacterium]